MNRNILLNCAAHCIVNGFTIGVNEEVFGVYRLEANACAGSFKYTNGCLALSAGNRPCSWLKACHFLNNNFTNACSINFSHQLDVVNAFLNFVLLKIFHQQGFKAFHIHWVLVYIQNVILNVKELSVAKDGLNNFSVASFYCWLGGRRNNTATLALTGFIFSSPLTTENTLILFPIVNEVGVTVVTPAVKVGYNPLGEFLIIF